jgi:hypothetical protein
MANWIYDLRWRRYLFVWELNLQSLMQRILGIGGMTQVGYTRLSRLTIGCQPVAEEVFISGDETL